MNSPTEHELQEEFKAVFQSAPMEETFAEFAEIKNEIRLKNQILVEKYTDKAINNLQKEIL